MAKKTFTYSMMNNFMNCRKKYEYRYEKSIVPVETAEVLYFGTAIHAGLESWFRYGISKQAIDTVDSFTDLSLEDRCKAAELLRAYIDHWGVKEPFGIIDVEHAFAGHLLNPETSYPSTFWILSGKVDAIVSMADGIYILEHKTTSSIDSAYLDRILIDTQIAIYAHAISLKMGVPVVGAIYDILLKPAIRMKKGETEDEFQARRAALIAKSKTGKSSAQRQIPESEEEFRERLRESITAENFRREIVRFNNNHIHATLSELWTAAADIRTAKTHYKNTSSCMKWGRPCEYLPLCRSNGDLTACPGLYTKRTPHTELQQDDAQGDLPW